MTPTAPSFRQNSALSSDDTTATGRPPNSRTIWMAIEPRPPAPPHTRTGSPSPTTFGGHPRSIRYAVAPTRVGAAAASHVSWGALGRHWWAWTFVNCPKEPQFDSYPQILNEGWNMGSSRRSASRSHCPLWTTTWSPTFQYVTASPTAYTTPEASEPPMWNSVGS